MRKRFREVKKLSEGHTVPVLPVLVSLALYYYPNKCTLTGSEDGSDMGGLQISAGRQIQAPQIEMHLCRQAVQVKRTLPWEQ